MDEGKPVEPKQPKAAKLDNSLRHFGTFTNFRDKELPAYLGWFDDDKKRGFRLLCATTHREFKPGLLVMNLDELALAKVKFKPTGRTEKIEAKK